MGPRPIGRGNDATAARAPDAAELLQWGRGRLAAETPTNGNATETFGGNFNGAAADWPRKLAVRWRVGERG